MTEIPGFEDCL